MYVKICPHHDRTFCVKAIFPEEFKKIKIGIKSRKILESDSTLKQFRKAYFFLCKILVKIPKILKVMKVWGYLSPLECAIFFLPKFLLKDYVYFGIFLHPILLMISGKNRDFFELIIVYFYLFC